MISLPPRDRDSHRFVADLAQEEDGGAPTAGSRSGEVEAVWDALGALEAADFQIPANDAGRRPSRRAVLAGGGLAAGVAAAVGGGVLWARRPAIYATEVGERRTVRLGDGSQVTLNTATRIEVHMSRDRRLVKLDQGEAFFSVAHQSEAPLFDVVSAGARIQVTGTRFNVRLMPAATQVDLLEGRVSVGSATASTLSLSLSPGQAVRLTYDGAAGPVVAARARKIDDWRNGRISFDHTPLAEAVQEMNRYSHLQLEVADPSIARLPIDGIFSTGDSAGFVRALEALHGVSSRRDGKVWTLSP